MKNEKKHLMDRLNIVLAIMLVAALVFFLVGELVAPVENRVGKADVEVYDGEWFRIMPDGTSESVKIPGDCEAEWGECVVIETVLSDALGDTWFCIRSSQQDLRIYVGEELRKEYSTEETRLFGRNSADSYIFFRVYEKDAGKVLRIKSVSDSSYSGYLNTVYVGEKNEIWNMFISMYMPVVLLAVFMLLLSVIVVIYSVLVRIYYKKKQEIIHLGNCLLVMSVWMLAESKLRQLMMPNSSVATYVGYFMIMLLPYPLVMYVDNVQKHRYQKIHMMVLLATIANTIITIVLQILNIKDFFETLIIAHLIIVALMMVIVGTAIIDIKKGYMKQYNDVAVGFLIMLVAGIGELCLVYQKASVYNGIPLGLGLVGLFITAAIKTGRDMAAEANEKSMAIAANAAKSQFLANMSHEIRTPINTVIGMNEMIIRESHDEAILEYSSNIQSASKMLLGLVNDVLDLSKIEAGKMEIVESDYRLSVLMNDVITGMKPRMDSKGLKFVLKISETLPSVVRGDELRVKQVINNVLSNAVKYTEKGSVTLSVSGKEEGDSVALNISITDTGIGIKSEDMRTLFDNFQRMELSKNRYVEGTGLGLAITKQLLIKMGGSITVKSEYGKGSCFIIELPQKIVDGKLIGDYYTSYKEEIVKKRNSEPIHIPEKVILAVDDNRMNLMVIKQLLKRTGAKLELANGGKECLELCSKQKFDLILMDHMMPELDGIETLHMLRADKEGTNCETPVIALTANAIAGAEENYIREGFSDYLTKPVEPGKLEEVLKAYLVKDY